MFEVAIFLYEAVYRRSPGYMLWAGAAVPRHECERSLSCTLPNLLSFTVEAPREEEKNFFEWLILIY